MSVYDDYDTELSPSVSETNVWTEPVGIGVRRVHYWVFRVPSQKRFILRPFRDANADDNAAMTRAIDLGVVAANWRGAEAKGKGYRRRRRADGTFEFYAAFGRILDDPLMQLELEMMIDIGVDVSA